MARVPVAIICLMLAAPGVASAGPLQDAAKAGDIVQIEALLAAGADINDHSGLATPLYYAIKEKHADAAALLIERGADVDLQSTWGAPLHIASSEGMTPVIALLLEHGADPNARWKGLTPLLIAARNGKIDAVRVLLDQGADINAVNAFDEPAIHLARLNDHLEVADLLVARGTKAPPVEPIDGLIASADPKRGEELALPCKACHTVDRASKGFAGPPLWNIVGRPKASVEGFKYSPALQAVGGNWTYADLNEYIAHPAWTIPGVNMKMVGTPAPQDRADLIAFLRTLSDNPAPLP